MAYAGFFFELMLGAGAHIAVGDGQAGGALVALTLAAATYATGKLAARRAQASDATPALGAG